LTYSTYNVIISSMSEHFTPPQRENLTDEQGSTASGPNHEQHEQEQSPIRNINYLCKTSSDEIVAVVEDPNVKSSSYEECYDVYIGTESGDLHKTEITKFRRFSDGGTTNIAVQRTLPDGTKEDIRLHFPHPDDPFKRGIPYKPVEGKQPRFNGKNMTVLNEREWTAVADKETGTLQLHENPAAKNTEPEQPNPAQPASPEAAAADLCRQSLHRRGRGRLSRGILWLLGLSYRR